MGGEVEALPKCLLTHCLPSYCSFLQRAFYDIIAQRVSLGAQSERCGMTSTGEDLWQKGPLAGHFLITHLQPACPDLVLMFSCGFQSG